jgi:hypothetical protein
MPFDLEMTPSAVRYVERRGGTAALDFIPPIS